MDLAVAYWRVARRRFRLTDQLQRWNWSGRPGPEIPALEAFILDAANEARSRPADTGPVRLNRVRFVTTATPSLRNLVGGTALIVSAPRGLGIRRELVAAAFSGR